MAFDINTLLTAPLDPELIKEMTDEANWAAFGRKVHEHMMSDRYFTTVNLACLAAGRTAQPVHYIAACIRAYVFTGTIAR